MVTKSKDYYMSCSNSAMLQKSYILRWAEKYDEISQLIWPLLNKIQLGDLFLTKICKKQDRRYSDPKARNG
jgi:hypothetical protein